VPVIARIEAHLSGSYAADQAASTAAVLTENSGEAVEETKGEEDNETSTKNKSPTEEAQVQMMIQDEQEIQTMLADLETFAKQVVAELVTDAKSYLTLSLFLINFYMRENSIGPSVYTEYVEDTLAPLIKGGPLPPNQLDFMSNKNLKLQAALLKYFERDGE